MVCRTKVLNQLGVTAPIESPHNSIKTLKSDRISPYIFVVNSPINIINLSCILPSMLEILTFHIIHFFHFFIIFTSSDVPY